MTLKRRHKIKIENLKFYGKKKLDREGEIRVSRPKYGLYSLAPFTVYKSIYNATERNRTHMDLDN